MRTFTEKFEYLIDEIKGQLHDLIEKHKIEAKHTVDYCLPVKDEDLMFNLEGGRYLIEVTATSLTDNCGYGYDHSELDIEEYLQVIDHLIETYGEAN